MKKILSQILFGKLRLGSYFPLIYLAISLLFDYVSAGRQEKYEYLKCGKFVNKQGKMVNKQCALDLYECQLEKGKQWGYCVHEDIFPMNAREIIGSIITGLVTGFANAGGAGGGFLIVPLVFGFFNYTLKESIMVSYIMVFGGAIGNYIKFGTVPHDYGVGPQVNYDIAMATFPLIAIGAMYGESYKTFFSDPIIALLECGLLFFAGSRTFIRLRKLWVIESKQINERKSLENATQEQKKAHKAYQKFTDEKSIDNVSFTTVEQKIEKKIIQENEEAKKHKKQISPKPQDKQKDVYLNEKGEPVFNDKELERLYLLQKSYAPLEKWIWIYGFLILLMILLTIKGGQAFKSLIGIKYCSFWFWMLTVFITCFGVLALFDAKRRIQYRESKLQKIQDLHIQVITYKLDNLAFRHFAGASFLAGYIGGILGLGGGILLTPIWLSINVEAGECVATSVFCQFSTCTVLCYTVIINMAITFEMMWYFTVLSAIASFFIAWIARELVEKYERESILLIILLIKIGISFIVLPILVVHRILETGQGLWNFGAFC